MKNQNGFTLIELVVVIVILGILAAVAVPKFVDMQVDARRSTVEGLSGALQSATALARAQALVKGVDITDDGTGGVTINMEGTDVHLVYGYPSVAGDGTDAGIDAAINIDGFDYDSTSGIFTLTGYSGANCQVTYAESTGTADAPDITPLVTGCN